MLESAGVALLLITGSATAAPAQSVTWSEVRADLGKTICVLEHELPNGNTGYSYVSGSREDCAGQETTSPLSRAVDAALQEAQALSSAMGPGETGFSFDAERSLQENDRAMRESYLASDRFLQPILRRLPEALAAEGLTCQDCPGAVAPPVRQTTWEEFVPYLAAYFWPDPVRTPVDEEGRPVGEPKHGFHICAGLNGISEIKEADPRLVQAGFVAAMATPELRRIAMEQFQSLLAEPDFVGLTDDEARTAYLRQHLGSRLAADDRLTPPACDTLQRYGEDLGLIVEGCPAAAE